METFYSDKSKKFICDLEIDGASLDETFARLSLSFDDDRTKTKFVYDGSINENGRITVKIPKIKNAPNTEGKATLEVIAESTYFEAWEGDFNIKRHKNVTVKKINEDTEEDDDDIKVNVIKEDTPKENKELSEDVVERFLKNIKKLSESSKKESINEDFDFLSLSKIENEEKYTQVLKSKEFQTSFIRDIVNNLNDKSRINLISSKFVDNEINNIMDGKVIDLEIEIKYNFNGNVFNLLIYVNGSVDEDLKELDDLKFRVFDIAGHEIKFKWVYNNEKLFDRFIKTLLSIGNK